MAQLPPPPVARLVLPNSTYSPFRPSPEVTATTIPSLPALLSDVLPVQSTSTAASDFNVSHQVEGQHNHWYDQQWTYSATCFLAVYSLFSGLIMLYLLTSGFMDWKLNLHMERFRRFRMSDSDDLDLRWASDTVARRDFAYSDHRRAPSVEFEPRPLTPDSFIAPGSGTALERAPQPEFQIGDDFLFGSIPRAYRERRLARQERHATAPEFGDDDVEMQALPPREHLVGSEVEQSLERAAWF